MTGELLVTAAASRLITIRGQTVSVLQGASAPGETDVMTAKVPTGWSVRLLLLNSNYN